MGQQWHFRKSQQEITDLEYYKQAIRYQYYNFTTQNIDERFLRRLMNKLVDIKNEIPRHAINDWHIMSSQFAPENDQYEEGIVYSSAVLIWVTIMMLVVFLIFIFGRFLCKRCEAEIQRDEAYNPEKRIRYVCGSLLITLVLLTATASTMFGNYGFF